MSDARPDLEAGLVHLRADGHATAVHRLALAHLAANPGRAYWIDAGNVASTYVLYDLAADPRRLDALRVARAFTAYQHHSLVRRVVERATSRTSLLVAPNLERLYGDDDLADGEARALFASALTTLAELAGALCVPALVTTTGDGPLAARVAERATTTVDCTLTRAGVRYETAAFETTVYWHAGYWQTTIPYWVDLLGVADAGSTLVEADRPVVLGEV